MHTPGYAAPEQHKEFFQPPRVGVWTDYYGLGATLYALLEKASPVPSPELLLNSTKVNIMARRKGQFSNSILNIVDYLMQTEWDKRKKINLKEVIESLSKIKPSKEIEMVTTELDRNLKSARKSFMDISKSTEDN